MNHLETKYQMALDTILRMNKANADMQAEIEALRVKLAEFEKFQNQWLFSESAENGELKVRLAKAEELLRWAEDKTNPLDFLSDLNIAISEYLQGKQAGDD